MSTKVKAKLLESQGYLVEASKIYKELAKKDKFDKFLREKVKFYSKVNVKILEFFVRMKKEKDYKKFKKWLYKSIGE